MARITRPQVPTAATNQLGIGTPSIEGALDEARANQELGQTISNVSNKYLQDSVKSLQDSQYNKAITDAQSEFQRASSERMEQQTDEAGNPTFGTMVDDVGALGASIQESIAGNIFDQETLARFNKDFSNIVSNRQIKAFDVSRQQHVNFTRVNISDTIQSTSQTALEDSPEMTEQYVAQIQDVIAQGVQSGALSPQEANQMEQKTINNVRGGVFSNQIANDPRGMQELLKGKPSELGITESTRDRLLKQADAAVRDEDRKVALEDAAKEKARTESQSLQKGELELGLIKGTVGEADIEQAFAANQISPKQRIDLLKQQARQEQKNTNKASKNQAIEDSIANGSAIFGMTPKAINDNFTDKVNSLSDAQGQPISIAEKAKLVKDYSVPVSAFAKEMGFGITQGSLEQAGELISSFDFLTANKSLTLNKLSDVELATVSRASELSTNTGVGDREALRLARAEISERTPEERQQLATAFDKIEEFQPDQIEDTIKEMFDVDAFTFIFDVPFTDTTLGRDVVPAMKNLFRNAYAQTGSVDAAINMTRANTAALFGHSEVGAKSKFMLLPPEQVYKVDAEILHNDLQSALQGVSIAEGIPAEESFGEAFANTFLPSFLEIDPEIGIEDVQMESDAITRDNPQNPSWGLYIIRADGAKVPLQDNRTGEPLRWQFDIKKHQQGQGERIEKAGTEAKAERQQAFKKQERRKAEVESRGLGLSRLGVNR